EDVPATRPAGTRRAPAHGPRLGGLTRRTRQAESAAGAARVDPAGADAERGRAGTAGRCARGVEADARVLAHALDAMIRGAGVPVVAVRVAGAPTHGQRRRGGARRDDAARAAELVRVPARLVRTAGLVTALQVDRDEAVPTGRGADARRAGTAARGSG